jgi:dienelactone hydrolase
MQTRRFIRVAAIRLGLLLSVALSNLNLPAALGLEGWPGLPAQNAHVDLPAQEWPLWPGPRSVRVLVHFPGGRLSNVNPRTGTMLTLHNWGGTDCDGTANPAVLAEKLNLIAICVNYLQSGPKDSIQGPEPYDFGYLQALDALRALWWTQHSLDSQGIAFARGRTFATGGSGGGNVALMCNKLAPRTFACVIDMCGMKKLSDDIAFNLPGGSALNARYNRDPASPSYLSPDHQELRFLGHPDHLATMKALGPQARILTVHGVDDTTCPFADAVEMVDWMQRRGLAVEPRWIGKPDLDGKIFTSSGHALGDRTQIVLTVAEKYLSPASDRALDRRGPGDFERREIVRYETSGGAFEIDYAQGFPVGRFIPSEQTPEYQAHDDLSFFLTGTGERRPVRSTEDWLQRRAHILRHFQRVTGTLPSPLRRVPLNSKVLQEESIGPLTRRKLSFQSDAGSRVHAYLFLPNPSGQAPSDQAPSGQSKRHPAVLCLHQTTAAGKEEPAGIQGADSLKYALKLAERGYVTLAPDYPGFGESAYDFAAGHGYASGTMKAVWDNIRAVDLLETLPEVDAGRIGCIGHSLGGHNAIFTAVFDERLKAVVSSAGFSSMQIDDLQSWTGPRYMPLISREFNNDPKRLPFDFHELVASIAPRAFFTSSPTRDSDFAAAGVREVVASAQPIYALLGKPANLVALYPEADHSFPTEARRHAFEFLDRVLRQPE